MAIMNFPENPSVGDIYTFEGYRYRWSGVKWQSNWVRSDTSLDLFKNELASEGTETVIAGVKAKDLPEAVLTLKWHPLRSKIWTGFIPADGQLVSRTLYPDAWGEVLAGNVPVCTEAEWLADPTKRACYTIGDGSTNFRVPDYNGRSAGSLGSVFLRGDGANAGTAGSIQESDNKIHSHTRGTMNITGQIQTAVGGSSTITGAHYMVSSTGMGNFGGTSWPFWNVGFDASRSWEGETSNEGSTEARPLNAAGCWVIKMFGAVKNAGAVDAASLATQVSLLDTKINYVQSLIPGRNLLINGGMDIWQRGTSFTGTGVYCVDRWVVNGKCDLLDAGQEANLPFRLAAGLTATNTSELMFRQWIESKTFAHLKLGDKLTLSAMVVPNKVTTVYLRMYVFDNIDDKNGGVTQVGQEAIQLRAHDWQQVKTTFTVPAGIKRGGFIDIQIKTPTVGDILNVTNVQLELGEVATPFEHRPYGYELSLCERYFRNDIVMARTAPVNANVVTFPVRMRVVPTITKTGGAGSGATWSQYGGGKGIFQNAANSVDALVELVFDAEL